MPAHKISKQTGTVIVRQPARSLRFPAWVRIVAVPSAIGVSAIGLVACGGDSDSDRAASSEALCANGADDDRDGYVDCDDSDCASSDDCVEANCGDGVDNDFDGDTDCDDSDCMASELCVFPILPD
jgi:hypothetical protein